MSKVGSSIIDWLESLRLSLRNDQLVAENEPCEATGPGSGSQAWRRPGKKTAGPGAFDSGWHSDFVFESANNILERLQLGLYFHHQRGKSMASSWGPGSDGIRRPLGPGHRIGDSWAAVRTVIT